MEKLMDSEGGSVQFYAIVGEVGKELERAQNKFPLFPDDSVHAAAIVNEGSGELIRAALQFNYEEKAALHMRKEAIQTAAMAIRFLMNFDRYKITKTKEQKAYEIRRGFAQQVVG